MKRIFESKVISILASLVFSITLLMVPNLALADDNIHEGEFGNDSIQWTYLWTCENLLDRASDISKGLYIFGKTTAHTGYNAGVEVQLQKYTSSNIWVDVPTYYWSDYPGEQDAVAEDDNVSVSSGVYRLVLYHSALNSSTGRELENEILYSNQVRVP